MLFYLTYFHFTVMVKKKKKKMSTIKMVNTTLYMVYFPYNFVGVSSNFFLFSETVSQLTFYFSLPPTPPPFFYFVERSYIIY